MSDRKVQKLLIAVVVGAALLLGVFSRRRWSPEEPLEFLRIE
jgi:hypothetical protein